MTASRPRLADLTSLCVGGPAAVVHEAGTHDDISAALRAMEHRDAGSLLILAGGSNVVISDLGFDGTVLRIHGGTIASAPSDDGNAIDFAVDAGVEWDAFVAETVRLGCTGIEMLSGIPGAVGAAPMQNINAYGQQVRTAVTSVEVVDRATLEVHEIPEAECGFGFRTSHFKEEWADRFVVTRLHARLALQAAAPPEPSTYADIVRHFEGGGSPVDVAERRTAVLTVRGSKSMLLDANDPNARSAGSFFISPTVPEALADELETRFDTRRLRVTYPEGNNAARSGVRRIPAAHVLRASGFNRGDSWGPVGLSEKHVLAIVTRDGATADDVWFVSHYIRDRVQDVTGVALEFEPQFIGAFPAYDRAHVESSYRYVPAPEGEPDWMTTLR